MAGLVPATRRGDVPLPVAGTSPAMTIEEVRALLGQARIIREQVVQATAITSIAQVPR
jgi:hypothetical protein